MILPSDKPWVVADYLKLGFFVVREGAGTKGFLCRHLLREHAEYAAMCANAYEASLQPGPDPSELTPSEPGGQTSHPFAREDLGKLFTRDGKDVWRVLAYAAEPTVMLENLESKERVSAVVGSPITRDFVPLVPHNPSSTTKKEAP